MSPRMVMPDGSSWPKPDGPVDSLEWTLRYGTPTREDMLRVVWGTVPVSRPAGRCARNQGAVAGESSGVTP